jgi:putative N6-adenine-specific DNA methylase
VRWKTVVGGLDAWLDGDTLARLADGLRIAAGLRVRAGHGEVRDFAALEAWLGRLAWGAWLPPGTGVEVRVTCHRSRLWHSDAVAQRARDLLLARGHASEPSSRLAGQRLHLRLDHDRITASFDAWGDAAHRRGERSEVGPASLRDTLAQAVVASLPLAVPALWDPCAGSGTLAHAARHWPVRMEAGGQGGSPPPAPWRRWPCATPWADQVWTRAFASRPMRLQDRSPLQLEGALALLGDAPGLSWVGEALRPDPPADLLPGTWMLANPPWGVRLSTASAVAFARTLGALLPRCGALGGALILTGDPSFAATSRLPWEVVWRTRAGGVPVQLMRWRPGRR